MTNKFKATIVFKKNWDAIHELNDDGTRKYKYIINEGSSRSSKTYSLIDCFDFYARSNENKRLTVWRNTKTDCVKTVLNDVLKHLKATGRFFNSLVHNKTNQILTYITGTTFEIHGTDDDNTVHGLTQDCAWLNEPYDIPKTVFDQIDQRTSDFIFIDWNPKEAHWIDDLKKDKRAIVIKSTFKDNPFCPAEMRNKILSYQPVSRSKVVEDELLHISDALNYDTEKNSKNIELKLLNELIRCQDNERKNSASDYMWSVYGLGDKAERPNRIFKWNEISLQDYFNINAQTYIGVDWGTVDPFGVVEVKYYDGQLYVRELNYDSENVINSKLTPTEKKQIGNDEEGLVKWLFNKMQIKYDKNIICDSNRPNKIIGLRRAGWEYAVSVGTLGGKERVIDSVNSLSQMKVNFTSCSKNIKFEQENYSRDIDKFGNVLEEPEDKNNHTIDPIRYVLLYLKKEGIINII